MRTFSLFLAAFALAACARTSGPAPLPQPASYAAIPQAKPDALTACAAAPAAPIHPNLGYVSSQVWFPVWIQTYCTEANLKINNYRGTPTDFRSQSVLHASVYRLADWSDPRHDYYLVVTSTMSAPSFQCGKKAGVRLPDVFACGQVVASRDSSIESNDATIKEYSPQTVNTSVENTLTIGGGLSVHAGGANADGYISYSQSWEQGAVQTQISATGARANWHDTFQEPKTTCRCFEVDPTANNTYETPHAAILEVSEGAAFTLTVRGNTSFNYYRTWDCSAVLQPCKATWVENKSASAGGTVTIRPPVFDVAPRKIDVHVERIQSDAVLQITAENPNAGGLALAWRAIKTENQTTILRQNEGSGNTFILLFAPKDSKLIGHVDYLRFTTMPDCATNSLEKTCDAKRGNGGISVEVNYVK